MISIFFKPFLKTLIHSFFLWFEFGENKTIIQHLLQKKIIVIK